MVKIRVVNKNLGSTVFESDQMELRDALETVSVLLKPSVFGVVGFQIVIERV